MKTMDTGAFETEMAAKAGADVVCVLAASDDSTIIDAIKSGLLTEAFGVGTAATIAQISEISCDGKVYKLPPIEKRTFSNKAYQYLESLKTGKTDDQYGWIYKV